MADRMVIFRLMAKHVARSLGCIASFMPKPTQKAFGSGAHLNISLADFDRAQPVRARRRRPAGVGGLVPVEDGLRRARLPVHRGHPRARRGADGGARPDRQLLQAAAAASG